MRQRATMTAARWVLAGAALLMAAGAAAAATKAKTPKSAAADKAGKPAAAATKTTTMQRLDELRDPAAWRASASDDVTTTLRAEKGGGICLDYDFRGVSGYAVMRRALALDLPQDYAFHLGVSGSGPANTLQFKLLDASGDNVWWARRPDFVAKAAPVDLRFKRRHITFAWGPAKDHELRHAAALEVVVAGGRGGKGSLCLRRLDFEPRLLQSAPPPQYTASATFGADVAAFAFDGRDDTAWQAPDGTQSLQVDFGIAREFNGAVLRWRPDQRAVDYDLDVSDDGRKWSTLRQVRGASGPLDTLFVPETEARFVRLSLRRSNGSRYALTEMELPDQTRWRDFNGVLAARASVTPRGDVPRAYLGEQNYWTLAGVDGGGGNSALVSEDGAIELGRGGFSVEPSVVLGDGTRVTWANASVRQSLRDRYLPLPEVHWEHAAFALDVEVCAEGPRDAPVLAVRYTLQNRTNRPLPLKLALAVRPWQVNPPQQFLNTPGGMSPIETVRWDDGALQVDQRPPLRTTEAPTRVTAAAFDTGIDLASVERTPLARALTDPQKMASASLGFELVLPPNGAHSIGWMAPLAAAVDLPSVTHGEINARFEAASRYWRERLNRTVVRVPAEAQALSDTLRTSLAHILMSRDGAALRPGTRSYGRTWVRDGAMMVAALLALGESDVAREFVDFYAGHLFASGKVPCCVDARGADPVAENDSQGEYLYAVAEVWRHTSDTDWLAHHWSDVARVTAYMESLRQSTRGAARAGANDALCTGLMPPSISHEGYSDKPACSYWDDFWALRGYKDAVVIARALGHAEEAERWAKWRDEFAHDIVASLDAVAARYRIDFIPGAADRGDFDPTSTTIALNPTQAQDILPAERLEATFERYAREAAQRAASQRTWKDYTPYELRNVGALTRLGQAERAHDLLAFFFEDQRPRAWRQWAEVVAARERAPTFIGDMPHAWISSDYIRAVLDFFVYERESDKALVIGAGVPVAWLDGDGVAVERLSTPYGLLNYRLTRSESGWTFDVRGKLDGLAGGLRLVWPGTGPLPRATQDGRRIEWEGRELPVGAAPATVVLRY
jgi:hypothetical protein